MSIQWTVIAGFLYFEIAVVIVMLLPLFSPRRWHQFFKSRLFEMIQQNASFYFYSLLGLLCLFLIDSIREIKKYSHGKESYLDFASEMKGNIKLFRAQRNLYITGFAIFLAFVIRRLVRMLIIQDELSLKAERIIKEAEATVKLAKSTVLANTIHTNEVQNVQDIKEQLKETEKLLLEEKKKVVNLEEEAKTWKLKYEELNARTAGDSGDK